ncbi:MAG: YdbH domain-containing protein [Verrucomicrobia bacterium]|nr:YdbH domain-containing protein [Verrucomicrobiota bacterium]
MASLGLLLCIVVWWNLPDLLNTITKQKLVEAGFEGAEVQISKATNKHLTISHAKLSGAGWVIEVNGSTVRYGLLDLIKQKEVELIDFDELHIAINPAMLESSGEPLTVEILQGIPVRQLTVENGTLDLLLDSGILKITWSGQVYITKDESIELILTSLQIEEISPIGDPLLSVSSLQNSDGLFQVNFAIDGSTAAIKCNLSNFDVQGNEWQVKEGSLLADLRFDKLNLGGIDLGDKAVLSERFTESASGTISATANEFIAGSITGQWMSSQLELRSGETVQPINSNLTATVGTLITTGESFEQLSVNMESWGDLSQLEFKGDINFLYDGIEGKVSLTQTVSDLLSNPSLNGEYIFNPMTFDYSDVIGRHVPNFDDLIFSGTISANGGFDFANGFFDASSEITLLDGSISIPRSNLEATGIQSSLTLSSLKSLKSEPGQSTFAIDRIELGDLEFEKTHINFDILDSKSILLTSGTTDLFDGNLRLSPTTITLNPTTFETVIAFERLSLKAIVDGINLFKGTMEGAISGHLPISFKDGSFQTSDGHLTLSEGETARLIYNTEGLFEPSEPTDRGFLQSIGDKILEKLKLAPENVVKDALSNLTILELRIDLFPEDSPDTPARIHLVGEGLTGKTKVPMVLDTNINGTTDELIQFLLRIHSLGTPSFQ